MSNPMIERLEGLLRQGQDTGLLRFSLGQAYLSDRRPDAAVPHLAQAVAAMPAHSAAWKLYGRALDQTGDHAAAAEALERGIATAEANGDIQAAKEMRVFLKRARKALGQSPE